ncbi:PH domain-containing protein [candidate division KSB1 bacterium]|nr:PH domain-containing protein [candidate division KSB1 bacterium]
MEKSLVPDKKFVTKSILVSLISLLVSYLSCGVFIHLIAYSKGSGPYFFSWLWVITILGFIFSFLISVPIILLWIKNLKYIILEDRVTIHKGILTKIQKNIPLRAVTDFILERSLFDRFFGIGSIKIQTAGQSPSSTGYEGKLSGLLDYEALHEDLRKRIGKLHPVSEAVTTGEPLHVSSETLLKQILAELKEIKKNTAG